MTLPHILLVDDDPSLLSLLKLRLEAAQYSVTLAATSAAVRATQEAYDLALVDLRLGDEDGLAVLAPLPQTRPALPVIMLTAHATIASAVEATQKGAYTYLTKPFDHAQLLQHM